MSIRKRKLTSPKSTFYKKIFILILLFCFSFSLRIVSLNGMGRTVDEPSQVIDGYHFIEILKRGDFNNPYLYNHPDHPPLTKYIYGLFSYFDIENPQNNPKPNFISPEPYFKYDLTVSRVVSAVFASLTVVLVVLIGWEFMSFFTGVTSGMVLSMLPFFIGLTQLATIESILFFMFTAATYLFMRFVKNPNTLNMVLVSLFLGLSLLTKYTNVLLFILFILIYLLWFYTVQKKDLGIYLKKIAVIFILSILIFILFWPFPFFHISEVLKYTYALRVERNQYSVPEVFFGRLMHVPKIYYVVHFLITTPLVLLVFFAYAFKKVFEFITLKTTNKSKRIGKWFFLVLAVWFSLSFLQSFYNFRQHGIRYIIELYAPFSLLCAIGIQFFLERFKTKKNIQVILLISVITYLLFVLTKISPYYLDYFNELVGGVNTVYKNKLFQLGWWGQGTKEAAVYLEKNAPNGSKIGTALFANSLLPKTHKKILIEEYVPGEKYDYVLVSYFNRVRLGFQDGEVKKNYTLIYSVKADKASLIDIYKRK